MTSRVKEREISAPKVSRLTVDILSGDLVDSAMSVLGRRTFASSRKSVADRAVANEKADSERRDSVIYETAYCLSISFHFSFSMSVIRRQYAN